MTRASLKVLISCRQDHALLLSMSGVYASGRLFYSHHNLYLDRGSSGTADGDKSDDRRVK